MRRVDGESNVADLGTKHLDGRRRDFLMDLMGLKMGRRLSSVAQVAMIASLFARAAAVGELSTVARETRPRYDDEKGSYWLMNIVKMNLVILALVGLNTLRRAVTRSIRSIGTQTDVTNPPLDADLRQHLMLQPGRSTSRSPSDEMERETAAYTAAGLANAASGFGDRHGLNFCSDTLTVEQLKGLCRDKKLAVGGLKRDLVARLASEAAHRTLWRA